MKDRELSKEEKIGIDKALHKYSSGNRTNRGKKIVVNLTAQMEYHIHPNIFWQGWLVYLHWSVGYLQKDKNYLTKKCKFIEWYFESNNNKKPPQIFFNSLSQYIKKFNFIETSKSI